METKIAELVIGVVLGVGLYLTLKRAGLTVSNPATRTKAITVMVAFGVVATVLMEVVAHVTR